MRTHRVLVICGSFEPGFRGGGPARSVARIVDSAPDTIERSVITRDRDLGISEPYPALSGRWVPRQGRARVFYAGPGHLLRLWRELRNIHFDLLYVNSLWAPAETLLPVVAARLGLIRAGRVLIAPRGELSPGALGLKARKKRLFLRWWGPLLRSMDVTWHATAEREAAEIATVLPWADIVVNGDMAALPADCLPVPETLPGKAIRLVFISRISPKKNLDLILRSLALLKSPAAVEFDIYGPIEDARHWARCQALILSLPANIRVSYCGELPADLVRQTFSGYDAFVFPTRGENFGHVIAESISASCPVICSDQTPFSAVLNSGGGWVLRELTARCLADVLDEFLARQPAERIAARRAAGAAYEAWRRKPPEPNVLELVVRR